MFRITSKDLSYALGQMLMPPDVPTKKYAWERELAARSPEFWEFIVDTAVEIGTFVAGHRRDLAAPPNERMLDEVFRMRSVLTYVFSAVYSACGDRLPHVSAEKIRSKDERLDPLADGAAERGVAAVTARIKALHPIWGRVFFNTLADAKLARFSTMAVTVFIELLLDEVDAESARSDTAFAKLMQKLVPSYPPRDAAKRNDA